MAASQEPRFTSVNDSSPLTSISSNHSNSPSPPSSTSSAQFRRTYKACLNCRLRKVKCDFGDLANPNKPPCARCRREGRECQLVQSRRGGIKNILAGRERRAAEEAATTLTQGGVSGVPGFGNLDDGNQNNNQVGVHRIGSNHVVISSDSQLKSGTKRTAAGTTPGPSADVIRRELHNTSDALEILAHAARSFPKISGGTANSGTVSPQGRFPPPTSTSAAPGLAGSGIGIGMENTNSNNNSNNNKPRASLSPPAQPKTLLKDCELIANEKIVTEDEVRVLVEYFFSALHPFYPFIPDALHSADTLADMPLLLAAITTLASRYYVPEIESHQTTKQVEEQCYAIHARLWEYTQKLISSSVWAEASTRSIGTVFAFLLFSEWNPRAIHQRWKDYANNPTEGEKANVATAGSDSSVGLGAARRSDRMAWMLIGLGIRLAQDLGLMETDPKVYLATHLSEIVLALRMGRRSMLGQFLNDPIPELNFNRVEQARLELLQIMSLAHETLYSSRNTTRELLKDGKYLNFLGLFSPHLDSWSQKYREILQDPVNRSTLSPSAAAPPLVDNHKTLDRESLLFDFHYIRLYIYSLALQSNSENTSTLAIAEIIPSARYVALATDAAKELLAVAVRVHSMGLLRRAPIRWVVRIVHATVFLVKSLMLSTTLVSLETQKRSITLIKKVSVTLLEAAPDEIHLASRYGTILGYLGGQLSAKLDSTTKTAKRRGPKGRKVDNSNQNSGADSGNNSPIASPAPQNIINQTDLSSHLGTVTYKQEDNLNQLPTPQFDAIENPQQIPQQFLQQQQQQQQQQLPQQQQVPQFQQFQQFNQMEQSNNFDMADDGSIDLVSMLDVNFDFLMEGTEGLAFVEPLMEGIEQQQFSQIHQQQWSQQMGS